MENENIKNLKIIIQDNIAFLDNALEKQIIEILKNNNFEITEEKQDDIILKAKEIYFAG